LIGGLIASVAPFYYNFYLATILSAIALVIFLAMARPPRLFKGKARPIEYGPQAYMPP
jgi:hypothetical protein